MFDSKSILITGGTGSFGKKYVKTLLERYRPRRLVVSLHELLHRRRARPHNQCA
jgi:FlaA1/EpsC-like NDP-sugar epimerase